MKVIEAVISSANLDEIKAGLQKLGVEKIRVIRLAHLPQFVVENREISALFFVKP